MKTRKRRVTKLPRVTLLAYNRQELQRFSDRQEQLSAAVLALTDLVEQLRQHVERLQAVPAGKQRTSSAKRPGDGNPTTTPVS
jgi:hypothetical protein